MCMALQKVRTNVCLSEIMGMNVRGLKNLLNDTAIESIKKHMWGHIYANAILAHLC